MVIAICCAWLACADCSYLLWRRMNRIGGLHWTKGDRALALFLGAALGPAMLIALGIVSLVEMVPDKWSDEEARW